jgi:galactoside O-acetyltransferase
VKYSPSDFLYFGERVVIYDTAKLVHRATISIGDDTQIDDFSFLNGGIGITLGRHNHICSFVSIIGGGELRTGNYVGMAAGCRIMTGSHDYSTGKRMVSTVPRHEQEIILGKVVLEDEVFLGSNCIVSPNVTIGEGAIICAGSFVTCNIKPWTVNMGSPARVVGSRPRISITTPESGTTPERKDNP